LHSISLRITREPKVLGLDLSARQALQQSQSALDKIEAWEKLPKDMVMELLFA
jgi:hypothetical protein